MFVRYFQKQSSLKKIKSLHWSLPCPASYLLYFFSFLQHAITAVHLLLMTMENHCNVQQGKTIEIKLESNPTTGYGWILSDDYDKNIISLISTEYKQSSSGENLVGAGGYEYFYFKAGSRGETVLVLNYARPWEEGTDPIDVFKIDSLCRIE